MNIVLIGLPGSGKSALGKKIAETLNVIFLDTDKLVVEKTGKSISELFAFGEEYFRGVEHEIISNVAIKDHCVIATGGGVVLKVENMLLLKKNAFVIFLNRSLQAIAADVTTKDRPLLRSGADRIYVLDKERHKLYEKFADTVIDDRFGWNEMEKYVINTAVRVWK